MTRPAGIPALLALAVAFAATCATGADARLIEARRLARDHGWTELRWTPGEEVAGLFLEIAGRAEFQEAVIAFAGGEIERIALHHAVRGGGLYALAEFPRERAVAGVTLVARARSARAEVAVRLVKVVPPPESLAGKR